MSLPPTKWRVMRERGRADGAGECSQSMGEVEASCRWDIAGHAMSSFQVLKAYAAGHSSATRSLTASSNALAGGADGFEMAAFSRRRDRGLTYQLAWRAVVSR